jgi:hypothetical protein
VLWSTFLSLHTRPTCMQATCKMHTWPIRGRCTPLACSAQSGTYRSSQGLNRLASPSPPRDQAPLQCFSYSPLPALCVVGSARCLFPARRVHRRLSVLLSTSCPLRGRKRAVPAPGARVHRSSRALPVRGNTHIKQVNLCTRSLTVQKFSRNRALAEHTGVGQGTRVVVSSGHSRGQHAQGALRAEAQSLAPRGQASSFWPHHEPFKRLVSERVCVRACVRACVRSRLTVRAEAGLDAAPRWTHAVRIRRARATPSSWKGETEALGGPGFRLQLAGCHPGRGRGLDALRLPPCSI